MVTVPERCVTFIKLRIPKATVYLSWPIPTSLKRATFPCTPSEPVTASCDHGVPWINRSTDISLDQPSQRSCEKGSVIPVFRRKNNRQGLRSLVRERGPAGMQNAGFPNGSVSPLSGTTPEPLKCSRPCWWLTGLSTVVRGKGTGCPFTFLGHLGPRVTAFLHFCRRPGRQYWPEGPLECIIPQGECG